MPMLPADEDGGTEFPDEPDVALRAGNESTHVAQVFPDLLYVAYNRSKQEMTALGNAGKLLREALQRDHGPNPTSSQVFSDVPQWAKEFAAVEAHEREHVRRLISTSYGLLCHAYRAQQLFAARELISQVSINHQKLVFPFKLAYDPEGIGTGIATPSHKALVTARLQQALETHIPTEELRTLEFSLAGWTVDGVEYQSVELPGAPRLSTLAINNAGSIIQSKWLTSVHLLELFGVCEEGNRLLGTGSDVAQVSKRLMAREGWYNLLLNIWFTQFPTDREQKKEPPRSPQPKEISLSFYRLFPIELFVAADLALWPPFTPEGLTSCSGKLDWTDINPPLRFARILWTIKQLGIVPGPWPEHDLNGFVLSLQDRICEELGWPTPTKLATLWHDHLATKTHSWFPEAALGGFRHSTTQQLLALRCERPGDLVVNNLDYQALNVNRSVGWITREANDQLLPIYLSAKEDQQANDIWFYLYALTPALLGTKRDRCGQLQRFPIEHRKASIEAFNMWGSTSEHWPTEDFSQAAATFLAL